MAIFNQPFIKRSYGIQHMVNLIILKVNKYEDDWFPMAVNKILKGDSDFPYQVLGQKWGSFYWKLEGISLLW